MPKINLIRSTVLMELRLVTDGQTDTIADTALAQRRAVKNEARNSSTHAPNTAPWKRTS